VVYVYLDKQGRPVASTKLHKFLDEGQGNLEVGQQVDLLIADKTDLGFKAVINNKHLGLIYHGELSQPLEIGAQMKGWVKKIRDDGKINLNVNALDSETRDELGVEILRRLKEEGGRIELSDKSSPEKIFSVFKVSKKNFKRAIGSLYKQRLIKISPKFIELVS
jgi:predicted RNA-binding protein (virulence factor B family)